MPPDSNYYINVSLIESTKRATEICEHNCIDIFIQLVYAVILYLHDVLVLSMVAEGANATAEKRKAII